MLTKLNVLRFANFRDQTSRYSAEPFTHNMHTTSLIIPDLSPMVSSSSITSFSTPVEEAEWAMICDLYLRNGLAAWLQISYHRQPCVPLWKTSIGCTKFYPGDSRHYPVNSIILHTCWRSWIDQDSCLAETKIKRIDACSSCPGQEWEKKQRYQS